MNTHRIMLLRTKMKELSDLQTVFDLGTWGRATEENACGYAACAMGHVGMDSRFMEQGLSAVWNAGRTSINQFKVGQDTYAGFEAGAKFFQISDHDSQFLFSPDCYTKLPITPDCVIEHIDVLLVREEIAVPEDSQTNPTNQTNEAHVA